MTRAIAIDIGGTTTKVGIVSADGSVHDLQTRRTAPAVLDELAEWLAPLVAGAAGIGVSVAGFVDDSRSSMIYNPNLAWLAGYPLRESLEQRFGLRVELEADSNAACLAEYTFGAGRGARRFLCLTIGTGVGGGMIVNGEIVRLAHGGLGDIGHVIVDPSGPVCGSGCKGCAEAMISGPGMEACGIGIPEAGRLLGVALASYAVILFPDVIAIAGGVSEAGDVLIGPARETFEDLTGPFYRNGVCIRKAALGWQAPLVGAAVPFFAGHRPPNALS